MTPVIHIALQILLGLSLVSVMIIGISMVAWKFVYYICGCTKNPIGKTALLAAAGLWVASAALVAIV